MAAYYDIDRANAALPELVEKLARLRELRAEVVSLRDSIVALGPQPVSRAGRGQTTSRDSDAEEQARVLHLRLQGVFDQMQAMVLELDEMGIQLRNIEEGLVDFPAFVSGRPVWLCWRLGEDGIEWWHEYTDGFDDRRRIEDLA